MSKNYDFIAIGDITTDAFIQLKDATVNCEINRNTCMLCVRFGDKIPYERVDVVRAVGNSPNAAVSANRLGLKTALVTDIGDDENGRECLATLSTEGVATDFVTTHKGKITNYHYVLRYEEERTILIKHEEYDYTLQDMGKPKWLYLSSLGENSLPFHGVLADYLKKNKNVKMAFQPGTFQIKLGYKKLKPLYEAAELFFCNKEEAAKILGEQSLDLQVLLRGMHGLGPNIVVITDGPDGAYTFDGKEMWHMPMYPDPAPPVDRTGAGDSFSSTFTSALALGKSIPEALSWGPINSMNVVQHIGAQKGLLTREQIEAFLKDAPADYKAQLLK